MIDAISKLLPAGNITLTFEALEGEQVRVLVRQIPNKADRTAPAVHLPPFTVTSAPATVMAEVETAFAELSSFIGSDINATLERVKADLAEQAKAAAEAAEAAKKKATKPAPGSKVTVTTKMPTAQAGVNFDETDDDEGGGEGKDGTVSAVTPAPTAQPTAASLFD